MTVTSQEGEKFHFVYVIFFPFLCVFHNSLLVSHNLNFSPIITIVHNERHDYQEARWSQISSTISF